MKALKAGAIATLPRCYYAFDDMAKNNALGYLRMTTLSPLLLSRQRIKEYSSSRVCLCSGAASACADILPETRRLESAYVATSTDDAHLARG
jgi:hypothetical protein